MRVADAEISDGTITFANNDDAIRYGQDHWNNYADNLPADQRAALFDYTNDPPHIPSYVDINGYLRGTHSGSPEIQADIDRIDQALAGNPTPVK